MAEPFSRRDWLKRAGLAGASIVALPELARVLGFRAELLSQSGGPGPQGGGALTEAELRTLDAICGRLIPTDANGPGAREARAANYIDRALGGPLGSYRDDYAAGLAAVNVHARTKQPSAGSFAELTAGEQDAILREMEQDAFFSLVRGHTLQGTFGDPIYGGNANMVGWDLIGYPGVRLTVSAGEQNMSTPARANHKSAYDYMMFSKTGVI